MGDLKPIGSEKLKGDEKLKRILDLTYYQSNNSLKESKTGSIEVIKEGKTGIYGIQKEKDGYYVKKGLNENSLDYIGGLFMKNKNKFSSYNEAFKKMEFLVEQEVSETVVLKEATKYVLKQSKPAAPPVAPATEEPVSPMPAEAPVEPEGEIPPVAGGDEMADDGTEDSVDYMSVLKKLAGKLQQKINKYEDQLESAEYKEIIKQVLSAVDLDKLEPDDLEEIISVFEDDEAAMDSTGEAPLPAEDGVEPVEASEMDGVASLDELINTPLDEFDEFDDEDEDEALKGFDDSFLNNDDVKRAKNVAMKDQGINTDSVKFDKSEIDSFPIYSDDESGENTNDEFGNDSFGDDVFDKDKYADDETDLEEELPLSSSDQGMGDTNKNDDVRELDLDELTNMVNNSVKATLGKYFE